MQLDHRLRIEMALHDVRPTLIARRTGLSLVRVSRIINGHVRPTPELLGRIEEAIRLGAAQPEERPEAAGQ